jgi:hypothetical protein
MGIFHTYICIPHAFPLICIKSIILLTIIVWCPGPNTGTPANLLSRPSSWRVVLVVIVCDALNLGGRSRSLETGIVSIHRLKTI